MRHYAGWESYIGEKLLSLWRSEDVEWSTTFYHATLCQLRVYNGKLTHLSVSPVFPRRYDLVDRCGPRLEAALDALPARV